MRGQPLRRNFQRILAWCCVSGALAIVGGLTPSVSVRAALWLLAVGVDLLGGVVGFYTPGLGRSTTREWNIEGGHFAERCQAFILIALGESDRGYRSDPVRAARPRGALASPHADRPATIAAFVARSSAASRCGGCTSTGARRRERG